MGTDETLAFCGDQEDTNWDERVAAILAKTFQGKVLVDEIHTGSAKLLAKEES